MKIGVFDSGVGGKSVAEAIKKAMPDVEVVFRDDREHLPYGTKSIEEIRGYVVPTLEELVSQGCQVIVIACNTVTTNLIEELRALIGVPLVGMEPMVKPAAGMTNSGIIAVCATPATLSSKRYQWLKDTYAKGVKVLEPDCSDWAMLIEENNMNEKIIRQDIETVCRQGADVIVLGCTHYHWIREDIQKIADGFQAQVIQPEQPVIEQLKRVINSLG